MSKGKSPAAEEAPAAKQPEPVLTIEDLAAILASDNVEILHLGLARFTKSCIRVAEKRVDATVSAEGDLLRAYLKHQISKLETYIPTLLSYLIPAARMVTESKSSSLTIARTVAQECMKVVQRGLASGKHTIEQAMLKLLVSVISLGGGMARDIVTNFNFTMKTLPKLLDVRKSSDQDNQKKARVEDVRSLYIRFLLSFLEHGDATAKKSILEIKDLVSSIFRGMTSDSYETISYVLTVLRRDLVDASDVPKYMNMGFFNNFVLEQLSRLYTRKEAVADQTATISDLVNTFLQHLCTQPGIGICHETNGWYPVQAEPGSTKNSGGIQNKTLSRFLNMLKPAEDAQQAQLLLDIMQACPELVSEFWSSPSTASFDPRPSSKWLAIMSLATRIISLPIPRFDTSIPPPVQTTCDNILPLPLTRLFISRGIQHPVCLVKYTTASVLALSLQKLGVLQDMAQKCASLAGTTSAAWHEWGTNVTDEVRRRVPDFQAVIAMHHQALSDTSSVKVEALGDVSIDAEEEASKLLLGVSLKLFRGYGRQFPSSVAESRFDYGKLVPVDMTALPVDLAQHVVGLLSDLHASFKWWNRQTSTPAADGCSHLGTFLNLFISKTTLKRETRRLIGNLLMSSFLFQNHPTQVSILLSCLDEAPKEQQSHLVKFLDSALCLGMKNMYQVAELFQSTIQAAEAGMSETSLRLSGAKGRQAQEYPLSPGLVCLADSATATTEISDFMVLFMIRVFWATQTCTDYITQVVDLVKSDTIKSRLVETLGLYSENSMQVDQVDKAESKPRKKKAKLVHATEDDDVWRTMLAILQNPTTSVIPTALYTKLPLSFLLHHILSTRNVIPNFQARVTGNVIVSLVNQTLLELSRKQDVVTVLDQLVELAAGNQVVCDMILKHAIVQNIYLTEGVNCEGLTMIINKLLPSAKAHIDAYRERLVSVLPAALTSNAPSDLVFPSFLALKAHLSPSIITPILTKVKLEVTPDSSIIKLVASAISFRLLPPTRDLLQQVISRIGQDDDMASTIVGLLEECLVSSKDLVMDVTKALSSDSIRHIFAMNNASLKVVMAIIESQNTSTIKAIIEECAATHSLVYLALLMCAVDTDGWKPTIDSEMKQLVKRFDKTSRKSRKRELLNRIQGNEGYEEGSADISVLEFVTRVFADKYDIKSVPDRSRASPQDALLWLNTYWSILKRTCTMDVLGQIAIDTINSVASLASQQMDTVCVGLADSLNSHVKLDLSQVDIEVWLEKALSNPSSGLITLITSLIPRIKITLLPIIMTNIVKPDILASPNSRFRIATLKLIFSIIQLVPHQHCKIVHIPVLLNAYKATTETGDLVIRDIFELYESNDISLTSHLLQWGSGGFWAGGIDVALMDRTIRGFDVNGNNESTDAYDAMFIVSALAAEVQEGGCAIRRAVESGAVGLAVMTLASTDLSVRKIGGFVLSIVRASLELSIFKERNQIKLILDGLKNAIPDTSYRVPTVSALFVALSLPLMLKPESSLFPLINRYWLQRAVVDLEDVPMYYELFFSGSDDCRRERSWMLRVLVNGLKTEQDYRVYKRRHVFENLMSFFSSTFCDANSQKLILEFMITTTSIPTIIKDLIYKSGLISFMHSLVMMPQQLVQSSSLAQGSLIPVLVSRVTECLKEEEDGGLRLLLSPTILALRNVSQREL
ncbi:hypothetical protein SmJEL517_g04918 [Synchytrium microbalum]|uniref:Nucleolar pre-ribosomal-associated protein 1 N-terminal domain-containing protein n=1 Tax=Synchytrium microbalum TaxID=1806994 RepID=A0A507BYB7_9FUNG|nr:uncharacterized protein SmJEL517_g04918 [Synchytrium microbalum]TPX31859.1 hypothetical protein SmJEL517_g04918 [Synchytrium microbalum]